MPHPQKKPRQTAKLLLGCEDFHPKMSKGMGESPRNLLLKQAGFSLSSPAISCDRTESEKLW